MKTMTTKNDTAMVKMMNKKSIMGKMKMLVLALVGVMALGFTSCSSNSDDDPTAPYVAPKATQLTAQPVLYITDSMLDVFDITYNADGESVLLTRENTELNATSPIKQRAYKGKRATYTSFPASVKATAKMKVKDGIDLKTVGKTELLLAFDLDAKNNSANGATWDQCVIAPRLTSTGVIWSRGSDETIANLLKRNTSTMEASFASAASVVATFQNRVVAE